MDEIVVDTGWRSRLDSIGGDRRSILMWSLFVAALVGIFAVYPRIAAPDPVIATPATQATDEATSKGLRIFVHVAGAVAKPGLYRLPEGSRIADAIEAAGGPGPRADLDAVNLAEVLRDGLKVEVPVRSERVSVTSVPSSTPAVVNLNTADQPALETIPGVGPVTATAILQHRSEIGAFETIEQLLDVTGIGPATLEAVRPYVTV